MGVIFSPWNLVGMVGGGGYIKMNVSMLTENANSTLMIPQSPSQFINPQQDFQVLLGKREPIKKHILSLLRRGWSQGDGRSVRTTLELESFMSTPPWHYMETIIMHGKNLCIKKISRTA